MNEKKPKREPILDSYTLANNEKAVLIENFVGCQYKVYAIYVNGEYDRRIKVKKW